MVAALATVSASVELLAASAWKFSSARRRWARWVASEHGDQHRDRGGGDDAERDADGEGGAQEQHDEEEIDGQHRHLAGEEAAQHVELAQALGDDARRRALEMTVGKLHQVVHDLGAHQRVEPRAGAGRQPAARHPQRKIERVDAPACRPPAGPSVGTTPWRRAAADHAIEHQHHEERSGEAEQVDEQRRQGELGDRPAARAPRSAHTIRRRAPAPASRAATGRGRPSALTRPTVICQTRPSTTSSTVHCPPRPAATTCAGSSPPTTAKGVGRSSRRATAEIDGVACRPSRVPAVQEAALVQRLVGQCRQAAHIGLAQRPAELLDDVKQRPHQGVDGTRLARRMDA